MWGYERLYTNPNIHLNHSDIVRDVYSYAQVHTAIFLCISYNRAQSQLTEMNFLITKEELYVGSDNKTVWVSYVNKRNEHVKFPVTYMHDLTLNQLASLSRENVFYECFS